MKTKLNKKFWLFAAALAFAVTLFANPVDVKAAVATPANVKQTAANDSAVKITWDKVSGAANYGVQYSTDASSWKDVSSSYVDEYAATAEIYNLYSGTTYYVRVCAYETAAVASTWSAPVKVDTAPGKLTGLKQVDADKSTATISWTAVYGATGYEVYYTASSNSEPKYHGAVGATSAKITLGANSAYAVYVYPYRNAAASQNKALVTDNGAGVVAVTVPSAPKSLNVYTGDYKTKTLGFSWTSSSSLTNTDGYELEVYQLKTNGKQKRIGKSTVITSIYDQSNVYDTSVKSSKLFSSPCKYRVRSYVTINGAKKYSNWSSYKTYVPQAVQKKLKATSGTSAKLTWSKVSGATSYTIYYKTSSYGKWKTIKKNVKGTSATVKYNRYGSSYYYVKANKVKVGKKKYNTSAPNKAAYWQYWTFR